MAGDDDKIVSLSIRRSDALAEVRADILAAEDAPPLRTADPVIAAEAAKPKRDRRAPRGAITDPGQVSRPHDERDDDEDPRYPVDGYGSGRPIPVGPDGLPKDCTVRPIGVRGPNFYYLDAIDQLRELPGGKHARLELDTLFQGNHVQLAEYWPKTDKDGDVKGVAYEQVASALMRAASAMGIWNPLERVRGQGAWRGENGELVLHCGDKVLIFPAYDADGRPHQNPFGHLRSIKPGLEGRFVYPGDAHGARPDVAKQAPGDKGPGAELLSYLTTWNWRHGETDARLLLGWLAAAIIGGALKWRPAAWITGGHGTGKSSLQDLIKTVIDGSISSADTTSAGLRQVLGHSTLPCLIDELEAEEDNRRADGVIKLARLAASGGTMHRGGQDHNATEFVVRCCFLFSSIIVPSMMGQDASRIAILDLGPLGDHPPPNVSPAALRLLGAKLRRRLIDGWPRLQATIDIYRDALNTEQRNARRADVFGTLLACADIVLNDHLPDSDSVTEEVMAVAGRDGGLDAQESDQNRMLNKLLSTQIDVWRGGTRPSVAELIAAACVLPGDKGMDELDPVDCDKALQRIGLRIDWHRVQGNSCPVALLIANNHAQLAKVFEGTHWAGKAGASSPLVQALRRLPGAEVNNKATSFAGVVSKSTRVPIALVWSPKGEGANAGTQDAMEGM